MKEIINFNVILGVFALLCILAGLLLRKNKKLLTLFCIILPLSVFIFLIISFFSLSNSNTKSFTKNYKTLEISGDNNFTETWDEAFNLYSFQYKKIVKNDEYTKYRLESRLVDMSGFFKYDGNKFIFNKFLLKSSFNSYKNNAKIQYNIRKIELDYTTKKIFSIINPIPESDFTKTIDGNNRAKIVDFMKIFDNVNFCKIISNPNTNTSYYIKYIDYNTVKQFNLKDSVKSFIFKNNNTYSKEEYKDIPNERFIKLLITSASISNQIELFVVLN